MNISKKHFDLDACTQKVSKLGERNQVANMGAASGGGTPVAAEGAFIRVQNLLNRFTADYLLIPRVIRA